MSVDTQLGELRKRIDQLDLDILELISQRAQCAAEVAEVKVSQSSSPVFYRPEREAQVLRRIMEKNNGPLPDDEVGRLFREIMSACLGLEQPTKVAYLGPEGTFTEAAAIKHFGGSSITTPFSAIDLVFREVEAGVCHYGVVPVENSSEGVVNHTLDSFVNSSLKICGEVELRVHHNLMIGENTHADKITRIYSHAQSFGQCRQWLNNNYPNADRIAVNSNADAAKRVSSEWNSAAIAGDIAAQNYNLSIINERIEDHPENTTRFLIIGKKVIEPSGKDKTSVMLRIKNRPGALFDLLKPFREAGVDMTRLESRPTRSENWSYVFFLDFHGHVQDDAIKHVFTQLEGMGADLKVLGSYPVAVFAVD